MSTENYVGKFVFVEAKNPKDSYYNGEYFCTRRTPSTLYCVKPVVGYGGHEIKQIQLIGKNAYSIIESWADDAAAVDAANAMIAWGRRVEDPDYKKQWVEYVYSNVIENAKAILRVIGKKNEPKSVSVCMERAKSKPAIFSIGPDTTEVILQFRKE